MKVAINGLVIDKNKAGIGHYGTNLINKLILKKDVEYTLFLQECARINYHNVKYMKEYKNSFSRIIDEQIKLPFKYKGFDLVHFVDYSTPVIDIHVPFIVTIHDLSYYKYPETFTKYSRKFKQLLTPLSLKRAAKIIADSNNTKDDIISCFPEIADKVRVIYPGRSGFKRCEDKSIIEEVMKKYKIYGNYILSVGTLEPRKNLQRILEAFLKVSNEFKEMKLVIIGKKGWLYEEFFDSINNLNIKDKIVVTGYVDDEDMPLLYSGAEVFVYPSLYEGFGLPPLEAMECGTPVVVSNTSSLPEVVGEAGMYCNPLDTDSIAEGICKILQDKTLKSKLSSLGMQRSKIFNWEDSAKSVLNIYKEIYESKS
ncbi:MAG: glycosyltransferase involved in cell wall biosynthesis [Clostridium sp.]|jgi:glycosyltransferase involved in cell wall biosynthesis